MGRKTFNYNERQLLKIATNLVVGYSTTGKVGEVDPRIAGKLIEFMSRNRNEVLKRSRKNLGHFSCKRFISKSLLGAGVASLFAAIPEGILLAGVSPLIGILGGLGIGVAGTVFTGASILLNNSYGKTCIDSVVKALEDRNEVVYDRRRAKVVEKKDSKKTERIYVYVKRLVEYMKLHPECDYREVTRELQDFVNDYVQARTFEKENRIPLIRHIFLNRLTDLEIKVFKQNKKTGPKRSYMVPIKPEFLTDRLQYLGVLDDEILKDSSLQSVYYDIDRIMRTPYEGCEVQLLELFKLAQDYAENAGLSLQYGKIYQAPTSKRFYEVNLELQEDLKSCEDTIKGNINAAMAAARINTPKKEEQNQLLNPQNVYMKKM